MDCYAKNEDSDIISKMEKSLFNMEFNEQNHKTRLKRIEENVYGSESNAPVSLRVKKLSKDLSAEVIGHEIKPRKDSFLNETEIITEKPAEDMDFSVVNNLEKKVFQYEFKTIDINHRLAALENQVLKKCYLEDDLSTRITRLQDAIFYKKMPVEDNKKLSSPNLRPKTYYVDNQTTQNNEHSNLVRKYSELDFIDKEATIKLVSLEKAILSKEYHNDSLENRLTRLEKNIFNSSFKQDGAETRLARIDGAHKASPSIKKYNENKRSKMLATAIEVGTAILMFLPLLL